MKPSKALQVMQSVIMGGNVPILIGGTGVGKSAIAHELAEILADGRDIAYGCINPTKKQFGKIDFRLSLYESVDLGGIPVPIEEDDCWVQKKAFLGNLPIKNEGLLLFDEWTQAHPSVQAVCSQLIYERRLGEYELPVGWSVVACGNRATDRAGSYKMPSHAVGRATVINFEHDTNDWLSWAVKNEVHEDILGFIQFKQDELNRFDPKILTAQPSPRSWTRLSDTLKTNPSPELWQDIAQCDVGELSAGEFHAFVGLKNKLPDLDDIVNGRVKFNPDEDTKLGMLTATAVALTTVIKEADKKVVGKYFKNALAYMNDFPSPEIPIFFVRTIVNVRKELLETSTFSKFKVDNQDLEM